MRGGLSPCGRQRHVSKVVTEEDYVLPVGGTTTRELLLLDFFLSNLDLPPSLCQADRRVQSAGWGLHSGLMGDVCGPALKSSPSRPLEPLPVIL